jgi:hypothetical protein
LLGRDSNVEIGNASLDLGPRPRRRLVKRLAKIMSCLEKIAYIGQKEHLLSNGPEVPECSPNHIIYSAIK